jgi:hypothetical protein
MTWWKTTVEGKMRVITIYSFNWRLFLALLLGGILYGLLFFIIERTHSWPASDALSCFSFS